MTTTRRRRWALAALGGLALSPALAACASLPDDVVGPGSGPARTSEQPDAPATDDAPTTTPAATVEADVVVTVASGDGDARTTTLTCPGANEAACAALAGAEGRAALRPVPRDAVCTEQYGGPQTATLEGTVDGSPVRATFSRTNGCEIARWDALSPLLDP